MTQDFSRKCPHCQWVQAGRKTHVCPNLCFSVGGLPNTLHFQCVQHTLTFQHFCQMMIDTLNWAITYAAQEGTPKPTLLYAGLTFGKYFHGYRKGEPEHLHNWIVFGSEEQENPFIPNSLEMLNAFGPRPYVKQLSGKCLNRRPFPDDKFVATVPFEMTYMDPREFEGLIRRLFEQTSQIVFTHGRDNMHVFVRFSDCGVPSELTLSAIPLC